MNICNLKSKISDGGFDKDFITLYGDAAVARKRYIAAAESFEKIFKSNGEIRVFSAPGRTEIGGNHTDHQHGAVIAGGVDLDVIAIVSLNGENVIRIKSEGYPMDTVDISDTAKIKSEEGKAISLIKGICESFKTRGCELQGFDAYTTSNVLKGSGLSSSAAFEVLVATVINVMFNGGKTGQAEIARIGQFAESVYFGKPSGLLDQTASAFGGFTFIDFKNPEKPIIENIELDIHSFGYTLCVVDTGGNHANLTGDYADITVECKRISNALGVDYLRDADEDKFYADLMELRKTCGDRSILRAFHFFTEQERVFNEKKALLSGDFDAFLKLVNESGNSSYDYLQNLYSTSNVNEQGLCLAIALTKKFLGNRGACRVHGGGFAGTVQCYIPNEMFDDYKKYIEAVFGEGSCCKLNIRPVGGYELK